MSIGKKEAYIMKRRKKDKSVLRKGGNVYVLDVFVRRHCANQVQTHGN